MNTPVEPTPDAPPDPAVHRAAWVDRAADYASATGWVVGAHVVTTLVWPTLGPAAYTIFMAAVLLASLYGGQGPGLWAVALATADLTFVFMPPAYSFVVSFDDLMFLAVFSAVALLTSSLQARRRSAEAALRRANDELERRVAERTAELVDSQAKLGRLVTDLLDIAEREQQRIGHDLHDGLGQELTGISMLSVALAGRLRGENAAAADQADAVAGLVGDSIRHTRAMARSLCPLDLADDGLAAALRRLSGVISRLPGVRCIFMTAGDTTVDQATAIQLYRIAQEAINNALRHGRARTIELRLVTEDGRRVLTVDDDGVGRPPGDAADGMGLRLMRHRAGVIGATLQLRNRPAGGTSVVCAADLPTVPDASPSDG